MKKTEFDNEKMVWGRGKISFSFFDASRSFLKYYYREIIELERSKRKLKILDVGCGAGGLTKTLKNFFPHFLYWACDLSKSEINQAKKNPQGINFYQCNAQKLPFPDNQFDLVIMNSVLDHTAKPDLAAREVFRVLKKGGVYLSATPIEADCLVIHGFFSKFKFFREHRLKYLGHIHAFSRKTLKKLIESADFRIEKVNYDWFYFAQAVDIIYYSLLDVLKRKPEGNLGVYLDINNGFFSKIMVLNKKLISMIQNIESTVSYKLPFGFFAYVKAVKE